jgi:hypothetical protein
LHSPIQFLDGADESALWLSYEIRSCPEFSRNGELYRSVDEEKSWRKEKGAKRKEKGANLDMGQSRTGSARESTELTIPHGTLYKAGNDLAHGAIIRDPYRSGIF